MSPLKKRVGLLLAISLCLVSTLAAAQSKKVIDAIESRLSPVGSVCMAGEDCASASETRDSDEPRSADEIYSSACASCHDSGASGAPILGEADDWTDRIEKGDETLYENAIDGYNAMPAMGLCNDCSEDEIKETVDYMVEESS